MATQEGEKNKMASQEVEQKQNGRTGSRTKTIWLPQDKEQKTKGPPARGYGA